MEHSTDFEHQNLEHQIRQRCLLFYLRFFALLLACTTQGCTAFAAQDAVPASPCVQQNAGPDLLPVAAGMILDCLVKEQPVFLEKVRVIKDAQSPNLNLSRLRADSDLEKLAKDAKTQRWLAKEPDLSVVEKRLGRVIKGVRLVPERLSITNSIVDVDVVGPDTEPNIPEPFAPVVFAKLVDFTGTRFNGELKLPSAQFMGDVRLSRAQFAFANINLIQAYFAGEAEFQCLDMAGGSTVAGSVRFRSMTLRGATFAGRLRFDCDRVNNLGKVNLSEVRISGPAARFDRAKFWGPLDLSLAQITPKVFLVAVQFAETPSFNGVTFSGGVAFNRANFEKGADFRRALFGTGSTTSFDRAAFAGNADFQTARFAAAADFSGLVGSSASFDFSDATFDGEARFHGGSAAVLNFENARFNKNATFALSVIGPTGACGGVGAAVINFDRAVFDSAVDLVSTKFLGAVNFSHSNFKPGDLLVSWSQLDGRLSFQPVELKKFDTICSSHRILMAAGARPVAPEEFYRRMEDNFRKQDRLSDATSAYFLKEEAAREEEFGRIGGCGNALGYAGTELDRWIWGYGVRPWFVLRAWLIGLVAFGLIYFISGARIVYSREAFDLPKIEIATLPVVTAIEPWPPDQNGAATAAAPSRPARFLNAMHVSLIAGTAVRIGSAALQLEQRSVVRAFVIVERIGGQILFALLTISVAQSIPHVGEVFSILLK